MNDMQNIYAYDPNHPIRELDSLDIVGDRIDGGLDLALVMEQPLNDDERTRKRLLKKIENYTRYYKNKVPDIMQEKAPLKYTIKVYIDAESASGIFALLEDIKPILSLAGIGAEIIRTRRGGPPVKFG